MTRDGVESEEVGIAHLSNIMGMRIGRDVLIILFVELIKMGELLSELIILLLDISITLSMIYFIPKNHMDLGL